MPEVSELDLGVLEVDEFAEFWHTFPRHKDRARAEIAYKRARRLYPAAVILEAAQAYAASVEGAPASQTRWAVEWLRAAPWNDRAAAPSPATYRKPRGARRLSPQGAEARRKWIQAHGLTEAEYEANKHDAAWLEQIKERGPREH